MPPWRTGETSWDVCELQSAVELTIRAVLVVDLLLVMDFPRCVLAELGIACDSCEEAARPRSDCSATRRLSQAAAQLLGVCKTNVGRPICRNCFKKITEETAKQRHEIQRMKGRRGGRPLKKHPAKSLRALPRQSFSAASPQTQQNRVKAMSKSMKRFFDKTKQQFGMYVLFENLLLRPYW